MAYVETLQSAHVLEAMLSLGWVTGTKPPPYVVIQAKCREKFENGGDGGRIKMLREEAIAQAMHENGTLALGTADVSPPSRLPDELQSAMEGLARDIGSRLNTFDRIAASHLDRYRTDAEAAANARVNAVRRGAAEQTAAFDDEISAALSAIDANNSKIIDLEARLTAALTAEAHAEGRASALVEQVAFQGVRIADLERELKQQKTGSRPPTPKQPVIAVKPAVKNAGNTNTADPVKSDTSTEPSNDPSGNSPAVQKDALVGGTE